MAKLYDSLPDSFLKKVLKDENPEIVESVLMVKSQFEKEQDKDKKAVYRDRLASAFWNLYNEIGMKLSENTSKEKRLLLRFGLLDLKYLSTEEQQLVLSQNFEEKDTEETIFYLDEWLIAVSKGKIKPSVTDESSPRKTNQKNDSAQQAKYERIAGLLEAEKASYANAAEKKRILEDAMGSLVSLINSHQIDPILGQPESYSDDQLRKLDELSETARDLKKVDKEMSTIRRSHYEKYEELRTLENEAADNQTQTSYVVDARTMASEIASIRQMTKMCVGRQGNHFPVLFSGFLPKETLEYNFKAKASNRLKEIENLDPSIFQRTFRQNTLRILPYVILTPGYGNFGVCWEPYDKYNKATSKGRIAVPIFCRNPKFAVTVGIGDFRWQVAKEMAGYHWMDEGLTGRYYEYVSSHRIKGDIKTLFINDYILWITKEAEGIQKLDSQDIRYIFWRFIPFPDKIKEELSNRGYYYNDLYKKEMSFRMSQGKT
jgi:hypothetical protein